MFLWLIYLVKLKKTSLILAILCSGICHSQDENSSPESNPAVTIFILALFGLIISGLIFLVIKKSTEKKKIIVGGYGRGYGRRHRGAFGTMYYSAIMAGGYSSNSKGNDRKNKGSSIGIGGGYLGGIPSAGIGGRW